MDQAWLQQRPHLRQLARSFNEVLQLADEQYQQGRASGNAVDYGKFEERVTLATAQVEQNVHGIALSGLDVDVPFICVWGKHYRRVHRIARTYGSLSGPVAVEHAVSRARSAPRSGARSNRSARRRRRRELAAEDRSGHRAPRVSSDFTRS